MFLKLDVSMVLADSPIARALGPNDTSDLDEKRSAVPCQCRCTRKRISFRSSILSGHDRKEPVFSTLWQHLGAQSCENSP